MLKPALRLASICGSVAPNFSGTEDYHTSLVGELRALGLTVEVIDQPNWGIRSLPRLLRAARSARADAILLQYPTDAFARGLLPHMFAALQSRSPLIVTLHEFSEAHPQRKLSLAILLARAAAIVTTAPIEAAALGAMFPWLRGRICIIPVGPTTPKRAWNPAAERNIVYFGQIRPEKGIEEFFTIRSKIAGRVSDVRFKLIGSKVPLFESYFEQISAAAQACGIEIVSGLTAASVADQLSEATIALLPFPNGASMRCTSLLAAAPCGLPIVTVTGKDTGLELSSLLRRAKDVAGMVDQVVNLLSEPPALAASHRASMAIADLVSWRDVAAKYAAIVASAASARLRDPSRPERKAAKWISLANGLPGPAQRDHGGPS